MDEPLQQAVAQLIERVITGVDSSVSFLQAELLEFITQLLMWHAAYNLIIIVFWWAIGGYLLYQAFNYSEATKKKWNGSILPHWEVGATIQALVSGVMILASANLVWLQIWLAPKVWLVEYAANLAGGK